MKLLLTGASTRLGTHVRNVWRSRSDMTLIPTDWPDRRDASDSDVRQVDFLDPEVAAELAAEADHILHLDPLTPAACGVQEQSRQLYRSLCGLYNLSLAAQAAGVDRFILGSTLSFFDRHPSHWHVNEVWRPQPSTCLSEALPWLCELSLRESVRASRMLAVCLRFGRLADAEEMARGMYDPRQVHLDDALHALDRALLFNAGKMRNSTRPDWALFHISAPGPHAKIKMKHHTGGEERAISAAEPFSYDPQHPVGEPRNPRFWTEPAFEDNGKNSPSRGRSIAGRKIQRVVIFGAGGPMGAAAARHMRNSYELRLCDLRGIEEIRSLDVGPGRPRTPQLDAPHEHRVVDMRNAQQVIDACSGMDAIVNCSVLRPRLHEAFGVNAVGAFDVARGAAEHGIRRVVQTGPFQQMDPGYGSYVWDYDVPVEAPARPLSYLYHHTKYLGQEAMRVFAEHHDLEVAVMLFWRLVAKDQITQIPPFAVSWDDSGRSLQRAVEAPSLPSPYEEFNVSADMPHRRFRHSKLRDVLGFEVRDGLERCWRDELPIEG